MMGKSLDIHIYMWHMWHLQVAAAAAVSPLAPRGHMLNWNCGSIVSTDTLSSCFKVIAAKDINLGLMEEMHRFVLEFLALCLFLNKNIVVMNWISTGLRCTDYANGQISCSCMRPLCLTITDRNLNEIRFYDHFMHRTRQSQKYLLFLATATCPVLICADDVLFNDIVQTVFLIYVLYVFRFSMFQCSSTNWMHQGQCVIQILGQ